MPSYIQPNLFDQTKQCNRCKQDKSLGEFCKSSSGRLGREAYCKACRVRLQGSKSYLERVALLRSGKQRCKQCKEIKPLSEFHKHARFKRPLKYKQRAIRSGHQPRCKECRKIERKREYRKNRPKQREVNRLYDAKHREARNAKTREWQSRHPDRVYAAAVRYRRKFPERSRAQKNRAGVRRRNGEVYLRFSTELVRDKMAYWGSRCWMCAGAFEVIDHVKPLSKGGIHILCNLRPACRSCNAKKHSKWPYALVEQLFERKGREINKWL